MHTSAVDAHTHVHVHTCYLTHQRDGFDHVYPHLHTAVGVICPGLGQP